MYMWILMVLTIGISSISAEPIVLVRSISDTQKFCYIESGFNYGKLEKIKLRRLFPSDMSYKCYIGCFCTKKKYPMPDTRVMNEKIMRDALNRSLPQKTVNNAMASCKNVTVTEDICGTGEKLVGCLIKQGIILADFMGYIEEDKL
uniref:Odorant-binding protein 3 n=1 Tax=Copidosoma floridanum TaxID=29053 RepID=V9ZAB5_COPFL|nr:odorant-binding protein 3 precursor [Copidosoma floridanum]